jgi:UDP-N-acetylmuramoylalanine--D-glutamate ligase
MRITLKNKRILVLGLGETGLSVLRWLARQGVKAVSVADSRDNPPQRTLVENEFPDVHIYTGVFQASIVEQAELIVISPGIALAEPAVQAAIAKGIPVIGDVELFALYRPMQSKVIGITGSNGKTTVTSLVGEICKHAGLKTVVAGNIGLPVLDALAEYELNKEAPDIYVLELSSFQLETTSHLTLDAATVLNISEDHMDRYADIQDYINAKARILSHAKTAVLNRDDAVSVVLAAQNKITFGLNNPSEVADFGIITVDEDVYLASGNRRLIKASELQIRGNHNIANALAAAALCIAAGIDKAEVAEALRQFKGLPHRVQWLTTIRDVDFYDDSKGTNVGASCAAIMGMTKDGAPQKVVLIAGGDGKGQDFSPLLPALQANGRAVVLIGRDAPLIEAAVLASDLPIYRAHDLPEAVTIANKVAKAGDAVLLSPACASFDMFKNYVHRAEVFTAAVQQLEATC